MAKADKDAKKLGLLFQELGQNPYKQLNLVFILISVIPALALIYICCDSIMVGNDFLADMSPVLIIAGVIILLGYAAGYMVIQNVLNKTLAYAAKAKRADELKSSFAMSLAHDLKSPLAAIKTNITNMRSGLLGTLTKEEKEAAGVCDETLDRMNSMLAELISTYMIEARIAGLNIISFDLREAIESQRQELSTMADKKRIAVMIDLPKKPLILYADKNKITRVINNILNNSIKYTPEKGKIMVRAYQSEAFVRMEFSNNGTPIPEDRLEKIFDKFERLDRSVEGQGLGLAIARDIVELNGGKIWASSGEEKPNCFTVLLPLGIKRALEHKKLPKRILIIEDDIKFADALSIFLTGNGYEVLLANTAMTGIARATKEDIGLIVLDIELPDKDGLFVLGELRKTSKTADLPIIISTANMTEGLERNALIMGANDFIQKPYDTKILLNKITTFIA